MANQIVKQPDGNFAIWSSSIDDFLITDATREEIIQEFVDDAVEDVVRDVNRIIDKLSNYEKPYFQFTMSYNDCLEIIAKRDRKEESEIEIE